jgi:L-iditol 2-dehydrogenase
MKAIRFHASVPRYAAGLAMRKFSKSFLWSGASCTTFEEVPEPALPSQEWVRVRTRYGGICGSDMGTILLHSSPYLEPLTSFPYTFGHESVGFVESLGDSVRGFEKGDRVVVEPLLGCATREITPLCRFCQRGLVALCERMAEGDLAPGMSIGFCRDTGGSWSESFVAHQSQLVRVPESVNDENAVLVEPFATGLHAVLQNLPRDDETVLVAGAGTIGLAVLAALRALGSRARTVVIARHRFQAESARKLGAGTVIVPGKQTDLFEEMARELGGRVMKPMVGKRILVGGADRTFECVGSDSSIDDCLRLTRGGGRLVLVGMPGIARGVDWTSIFVKELEVHAAFCYHHAEQYAGETFRTFDLAVDLLARGEVDLGWMLSHTFALSDYKKAFSTLSQKGKHKVIKTAFAFDP